MEAALEFEQVARLLGGLLLHELTVERLEELSAPELRAALSEVGIELPASADRAVVDQLAAEFFEAFVQPQHGGPLVQSLWTEGSYEGDTTVTVRKLAEAAAVDFDRRAARGAPVDHLGSLLVLWAATRTRAPQVAERLAQDHLAWSLGPLERLATGSGFYAGVARATAGFVRAVIAERP